MSKLTRRADFYNFFIAVGFWGFKFFHKLHKFIVYVHNYILGYIWKTQNFKVFCQIFCLLNLL